jgi:hypothetical protein
VTAIAALLSLPAAAQAGEYFIPEGNAAVTQYAETYPSAGGEKSGHGKQPTARATIGARHAKKLQAAGPEGAAAAQVAVETAPVGKVPAPATPQGSTHRNAGGDAAGGTHRDAAPREVPLAKSTKPGSAAGEVAAKALGADSPGQLGVLLPVVLLASLAGAIAYWLKHRGELAG